MGTKIYEEKHRNYRTGVGMIIYLVKHTWTNIENAVHELSKDLDRTIPAACKQLMQMLKYLIDTKNLDLNFEPEKITQNENQNIFALSDSDFYGDKETSTRVSGFILYLLGVTISYS